MGYFANLYIVEADATDAAVSTRTMIYSSEIGPVAYFCWGGGQRPPSLHSYAGDTLQSDAKLELLPGYPLVETLGAIPDRALLEANFQPRHENDPVLFHFVLPERFVPRTDMNPLQQPFCPLVCVHHERFVVTYPVVGPATIRFWITRMANSESIADFDYKQLLHRDEKRLANVGVEFNFGVLKLKLR